MDTEGLSLICAGLGIAEEDDNGNRIGYSRGQYCLDNLKDLLRFLRRDDPHTRDVFKQVCKWNIVSKDLIPIIEHCQDDRNLVLNAVKVLVFLTMPIEPTSKDISQQLEYLWGLKSSVTCSDIVAVIVSLLESPLENLESETFTEDDWKLVQLVLSLFRNVLAIQEVPLQQKAGGCASQFLSLRERFLELLFRENVMDLIIVITQHVGGSYGYFRQDNLLLLEIFHYIFMGQEPELTAKAHLKGFKKLISLPIVKIEYVLGSVEKGVLFSKVLDDENHKNWDLIGYIFSQ
nr:isoform 2 of protein timeless like [Quercus suber]